MSILKAYTHVRQVLHISFNVVTDDTQGMCISSLHLS